MNFPNFIGPTYQSSAPKADYEDCINWIPELVASPGAKNRFVYLRTPGLALFTTLPKTPLRGVFPGENRLFAIAGTDFYEVFANGSFTSYGSVGNDGLPADLTFNGSQVLIASAGWAWVDDGVTLAPAHFTLPWTDLVISAGNASIVSSALLPFTAGDAGAGIDISGGTGFTVGFYTVVSVDGLGNATLSGPAGTTSSTGGLAAQRVPAVRVAYLDGYFWAQAGSAADNTNSKVFHLSAPLDAKTWEATQFASKEGYPDNINAMFADHEEMYLLGTEQSSEVWRANGAVTPAFPYERDPGAFMHHGSAASFGVARFGNGIAWLARDQERGGVYAVYALGYTPEVISTPAVETIWNGYSKTSDAIAYSEIRNGRQFFMLNFPAGNATWAYDLTTKMWHRRGHWNGSTFDRQRVTFQCYLGLGALTPTWYGADWQNGKIYTVSATYASDDGVAIQRQRTAPVLANEADNLFHSRLTLDMQGATGLVAYIEWSDDGTATWSNKHYTGWQPISNKRMGLVFRRLGKSRGRVYRLTLSSTTDVALINAYINETPGEN